MTMNVIEKILPTRNPGWFRTVPARTWAATAAVYAALLAWVLR